MNSQLETIHKWLKSLSDSPNVTLPHFEPTEENVRILADAAESYQRREFETRQILALQKRQIQEYRAECAKKCACVERVLGVSPLHMRGPVQTFLNTLSAISVLLYVDDPSIEELSLRLSEYQVEAAEIPLQIHERSKKRREEKAKNLRVLSDLSHERNVSKTLAKDAARNYEHALQTEKKMTFVKEKQAEYTKKAAKLEQTLLKNGMTTRAIEHDNLVTMKEELVKLRSELEPLKAKLSAYHELPPNLESAKVRVAEAEGQLADLTAQLTKEIAGLQV